MKSKGSTLKWVKHIVFFIIGIAIIIALIYNSNFDSLSQLKDIQPRPLFIAFILTIGITGAIAYRWGTVVNSMEGRKTTSWFNYYYYFILSRALGFVLPKDITDFGVRIFWLRRNHNARLADAGISVITDRFFDFLVMCIMLISVLPYWLGFFSLTSTIVFTCIVVVVSGLLLIFKFNTLFVLIRKVISLVIRALGKIPFVKMKQKPLTDLPDFGKKTLVQIFLASIFKVLFTMLRFLFFAYAVNVFIDPEIIILGTPVGQLAYLFSFTPGGLGIFEAGWYGILKYASVNEQAILLFVIGQRALTYVIVIVLALLSQIIVWSTALFKKLFSRE